LNICNTLDKGSSSYSDVRARAREFKASDPFGHRAEFIRLVDAAEGVGRVSRRSSRD